LNFYLIRKHTLLGGCQARNQLGTPGGAKSFLRGAQIFEVCPILLNYVQHIFPGDDTNFLQGANSSLVTGLVAVRRISFLENV